MKRKMSNMYKLLLATIICVLIVLIGYIVLQVTIGKKADAYSKENKSLEEEYETLQVYIENEKTYREQSEANYVKINDILKLYTNDTTIKSETHEVENWLYDYAMKTSSLTVNVGNPLSNIRVVVDKTNYDCATSPFSISYNMPYDELKRFIHDLRENKENIGIESVSIQPDNQNGTVMGNFNLIQYIIYNSPKEYEEPVIDRELGVTSLFPNVDDWQ